MSVLNILKIRQQQNGYVMSQSVSKSDDATKAYLYYPKKAIRNSLMQRALLPIS